MALTKADLAECLFNELGLNKREAKEFVEVFFESIRAELTQGGQVKLSGFGNFGLRHKKSRPGRNPKTGQEILVTARRVVTFRASHKLKERVEQNVRLHADKNSLGDNTNKRTEVNVGSGR